MYPSNDSTVVIAVRFPKAAYEQIRESAERNLRGIGRETAALALAGLQEQEKRNEQKQQVS